MAIKSRATLTAEMIATITNGGLLTAAEDRSLRTDDFDSFVSRLGDTITGTFAVSGAISSDVSFILQDPGVGTNTITLIAPTLGASYVLTLPVDDGTSGQLLTTNGSGVLSWSSAVGSGTVTTVGVSTNQGVSGVVANPTTTPSITLSLGVLTGVTSINGLTITPNTGVVTSGTWNAGAVTSTGSVRSAVSLVLEDPGVGTNTITLVAPALGGNYVLTLPVDDGTPGQILSTDGSGFLSWVAAGGTGTVTSVSVVTSQGVSGSVATATTTPAITLTLGALTGITSINTLVIGATGIVTTGVWNGTAIANGFIASALSGKTYEGNTITTGTGTLTLSTFTLTVAGTASISGTNTGDQTSVSGNAGTATALQTARTINGTSFNGTANITVTAAASTLTGTALNVTVVTSSLTSVGTIATGVWNGTAIGAIYGGTSFTTYATGDIIYASAANTLSKLAAGTNGFVLTLAAGVPTWAAGGGSSLFSVGSGGADSLQTVNATDSSGIDSISIGLTSLSQATGAIALGTSVTASNTGSVAIGAGATANGDYAISIGESSNAQGIGSIVLGSGFATALFDNSIALGQGAATTALNQLMIGSAGVNYTFAFVESQNGTVKIDDSTGSNITGGQLTIAAGKGTGTGVGGALVVVSGQSGTGLSGDATFRTGTSTTGGTGKTIVASGSSSTGGTTGDTEIRTGSTSGTAGTILFRPNTVTKMSVSATAITLATAEIHTGLTSSTGAAAVAITGRIHQITTTGIGDALTLADGTAGQRLTILYVAEGAGTDTAILTPTTLAGAATTITFAALGDSVEMVYSATGGWYVVGSNGAVIA